MNINEKLKKMKAKLEKIQNPSQGGGGDSKYIQLTEGKNQVRVLPYESEQPSTEGLFYVETATHQITENGQTKYVHCPRAVDKDKKCPICERYWELWKIAEKFGSEEIKKLARSLKPRARYYANVIDRGDGEVKILSHGMKLNEQFMEAFLDEEVGDFTDLKTGRDWDIIKKIVDKKFPNYDSSKPKMKATEIPAEEAKVYLEKMHKLEDCVKYLDEEELQRLGDIAFLQVDELLPKSKDEDEEEAPFDTDDESGDFQKHLEGLKD